MSIIVSCKLHYYTYILNLAAMVLSKFILAFFYIQCPIPSTHADRILLHAGGPEEAVKKLHGNKDLYVHTCAAKQWFR